ncbi:MAG TPA: hypothetical protein DCP90_06300 [Clostridiales bacterium]|nr:MAG: hypothetical protein A2Y22_00975 [Clostridiales bacterium GWD2_32_59]HAN10206.1 hypothetical protein [Clostridiales bacterium]
MMRSLYSAVSGLRVHQTKMDVIGNNIANVNTTGYKSSTVSFCDVFNQTLQGGTGASDSGLGGSNPMQIGLGVSVSSIDVQMTPGASQRTDNSLDLQISNDGFFIVTDGAGQKFTRAGSFRLDSAGSLVNASGYKVCGWPVNTDTGEIIKGTVRPLSIMGPTTYSVAPNKTTSLEFSGNINLADGDPTGNGIPMTMNFYDSIGNKYTAQMTTTFDTTSGTWQIPNFDYIKDSKGNDVEFGGVAVAGSVLATPIELEFDSDGNIMGTSSFNIDFSSVTPFDGINSEVGQAGVLTLDFENMTQYSSTTSVMSDNDGNEPGNFSSFSVGGDGIITAKYSNGDTKVLGQVVLAKFKNPTGLLKAGDNLFETSPNSGPFDGIGVDPSTTGGLESGVLEMSNVDLSREFTEMITTQRGFQANSKIITTSDEMLQELTNLKR